MTTPELEARAKSGYATFLEHHRGVRKGPPWELLPDYDKQKWIAVVRQMVEGPFNHNPDISPVSSPPANDVAPHAPNIFCKDGFRDCKCAVEPVKADARHRRRA